MIHLIQKPYNLTASLEDKALDWKAQNVKSYWKHLFLVENDLKDIQINLIDIVSVDVYRKVNEL